MQSNFFNSFFSFYMILNYFIQPVFMVLVVFLLYRIAKHIASIDKQNKLLIEELNKKGPDVDNQDTTENQNLYIQEE